MTHSRNLWFLGFLKAGENAMCISRFSVRDRGAAERELSGEIKQVVCDETGYSRYRFGATRA